jgi:hypothetical protein
VFRGFLRFFQADACVVPAVGHGHFLHSGVHFIIQLLPCSEGNLGYGRRRVPVITLRAEHDSSVLRCEAMYFVMWVPAFRRKLLLPSSGAFFYPEVEKSAAFSAPSVKLHGVTWQKTATRHEKLTSQHSFPTVHI